MTMTADLSPTDSRLIERALDTATELFTGQDVRDVQMTAIANQADLDPVMFRRLFPTKLDLIYALALRVTRELVAQQRQVCDPEQSPTSQLAQLVRTHIEFTWHHRTAGRLRRELLPVLRSISPGRHRELTEQLRDYREHLRTILSRGRALGEFCCPHPEISASSIIDALDGIHNWYDPSADLSLSQLSDVYVDMVLHHLLRVPR
ncbi:TetR/AcrR family transcriptional regulator [Salinactinospora qingdaonensis]|uniref:HTH-type transcriptional repressor KstR2 C-terminal domain-containing protein n=1 Tax=Salinactinospora qingdaonensis TaxID=702744 RepID=A0ABP7FB77_9ACTN